ncbi:hypothetical protein ICW40_10035 [Actinotalea ferrariae]|uniref:hypothetical protein n=1 Tax=Actinotalea ferrariae TaxID=1386098 RepID=UPI001C8B2A6B|nr:hypothetical protein [Actinotalea ferrariae]MBX9245144.1 hypothetical protein [Actinotalea ferrariae]
MSDLGNSASVSTSLEDSTSAPAIPAQVLARWAAMAGERACFNAVPTQLLRAV